MRPLPCVNHTPPGFLKGFHVSTTCAMIGELHGAIDSRVSANRTSGLTRSANATVKKKKPLCSYMTVCRKASVKEDVRQ
jgi:hypothetical protein